MNTFFKLGILNDDAINLKQSFYRFGRIKNNDLEIIFK